MLYVVCIAKEIENEQIKVFNCLQYVNNLIWFAFNPNQFQSIKR